MNVCGALLTLICLYGMDKNEFVLYLLKILAYTDSVVWMLDELQGGSNMTGTDLYVNKPHCAAAVRP